MRAVWVAAYPAIRGRSARLGWLGLTDATRYADRKFPLFPQSMGGASTCDPTAVVQPEFGADYAAMQNASGVLQAGMDVRLQYEVATQPLVARFTPGIVRPPSGLPALLAFAFQVVTVVPAVDVHGADDVALAMAHDLERSRAILDTAMALVRKILGFMIIGGLPG